MHPRFLVQNPGDKHHDHQPSVAQALSQENSTHKHREAFWNRCTLNQKRTPKLEPVEEQILGDQNLQPVNHHYHN